jgi:hypothetical protein
MSLILQAPLPGVTTSTVLPNPEFNDSEGRRIGLDVKRAMDGTKRSFVKSNARAKLQYSFRLSRMKALELRAFVQTYFRAGIRLTNHKDEVWEGNFISNPFEFETEARAGGWPGNEIVEITLELEATRTFAPSIPTC